MFYKKKLTEFIISNNLGPQKFTTVTSFHFSDLSFFVSFELSLSSFFLSPLFTHVSLSSHLSLCFLRCLSLSSSLSLFSMTVAVCNVFVCCVVLWLYRAVLCVCSRFVLALTTKLCAQSRASRVYFQNAPVCAVKRPCHTTHGPCDDTHGSVLNVLSLCLSLSPLICLSLSLHLSPLIRLSLSARLSYSLFLFFCLLSALCLSV